MAASLAMSPYVGGDNLKCANLIAVEINFLFFEIMHPTLAPQRLYLLETESIIIEF